MASDVEEETDDGSEQERPQRGRRNKEKFAKFKSKVDRSGILYMSRVPPHLKPLRLRHMLEGYAKLGRIYMAPKEKLPTSKAAVSRGTKKTGTEFGEAWIEFEDKKLAKAVAEMLNGQPMGGKHRSRYRDDLWTLKYLPKFKWGHLTEEIAYQKAVREKKLAQELASAKRERDFYLGKVAQAKKNQAIVERKRKKGIEVTDAPAQKRKAFSQREPKGPESASGLSPSVLAMFGGK
eukprot:TRINITY_DN16365_c0_g1_i1.p1 TRINITY_DN16365_c0_g1~~TRINITY_DN16365_c0_g1_i1.p1  ORF type:complete len:235 (-),score=36.06 TRINITY_DN16365_c0_g1_i1:115-819(-)